MASLSTHVLDTAAGRPAVGVHITLESDSGAVIGEGATDADGRVSSIGPEPLPTGDYRLRFDTGRWYEFQGVAAFYPEVVVTFRIQADEHHHVPLLLSPYGYSTYRGS
ncbi:hydroxyisourate hydrolase [Nocardioides bigeumensis]|uniref:5-hydroxyisourate hydrolase n=1 Tax=Nocardioides bigeumensis TaxID=433657 RepID=A0ABP5JP88_9ACTN